MKLIVEGMMCMHCVKSVTDALSSLDGVEDVAVDLASKEVSFNAEDSMRDEIVAVIEDLGFEVK